MKRPHKARIAVLFAAVIATGVAVGGSAAAAPTPAPTAPAGDLSAAQFNPAAATAGEALQAYLGTEPSTNNGVSGADPNKALTVHLLPGVTADAGLQKAVAAAQAAGITVTYDAVTYSAAALNAKMDAACADTHAVQCWVNPATDRIEVTVDAKAPNSAQFVSAAQLKYGAMLTVISDPAYVEPQPLALHRYDDTAPVYGSDTIYQPDGNPGEGNLCTMAFAVQDSAGGTFGMSAGHCAQPSTPNLAHIQSSDFTGGLGPVVGLYNGSPNYVGTYCPDTQSTVKCYDWEVFGSPAPNGMAPYVWIGVGNSTVRRHVDSVNAGLVGANVIMDGSRTGQSPSQKITFGPGCVAINFKWNCDMYETTPADGLGEISAQAGDSGGPVIAPSSGAGIVAIGLLTAASGSKDFYLSAPQAISQLGAGWHIMT